MSLGKKIKQLRQAKGLNQKDVADSLGVDASTVSKWETDQIIPRRLARERLAELFGVSINELLFDHERKQFEEKQSSPEAHDDFHDTLIEKYPFLEGVDMELVKKIVTADPMEHLFFDEFTKLSDEQKNIVIKKFLEVRNQK